MEIFLGAHQSIAGGIEKSILRAAEFNSNSLQIFTKNSNRWKGKAIPIQNIEKFLKYKEHYNIKKIVAHSPYLINLASSNLETIKKSKLSLMEDINNCIKLKIKYLVLHPGSHKGAGIDKGINNIAKNLDSILSNFEDCQINILLETTAGQGNSVGHKLEHLSQIYNLMEFKDKIKFCLDTCHLFAAGYDFRTEDLFNELIENIEKTIGIENVKCIHLNDSKKPIGSKVDRHEHIGKGEIGIEPFAYFLNYKNFQKVPFIIETPKENNMDIKNLKILKTLIKK